MIQKKIFLFLLITTALVGCKRNKAKDESETSSAVSVQVMQLQPTSISRILKYDADIKGELEVKVFSQVTERLVSLRIDEGDRVKRGQILAVVRAVSLEAGVNSATAAIDAAQADRDNLKQELERQQKLLAKNIVSPAQVDSLRAKVTAAEAQLRRLDAMASQASTARGNAVIRSPIDGVIGQRFLSQGDFAAPSIPLCTVVQMDRVELNLDVREQDLGHVHKGMRADIIVSRYKGLTFLGSVDLIAPMIDRNTRTARVKVVVENKDHKLMPGMLAQVNLEVERRDNVVVVPYSSLVIEPGAKGDVVYQAFVLTNNKAKARLLEIGIISEDRVEIRKGLSFAEWMVTKGQHLVKEGQEVKVVERIGSNGEIVSSKKEAAR